MGLEHTLLHAATIAAAAAAARVLAVHAVATGVRHYSMFNSCAFICTLFFVPYAYGVISFVVRCELLLDLTLTAAREHAERSTLPVVDNDMTCLTLTWTHDSHDTRCDPVDLLERV
jgi:hypothetical protein